MKSPISKDRYTEYLLNQIQKVIEDCDFIQNSNESDYTKEKAKITAYDSIKELIQGN